MALNLHSLDVDDTIAAVASAPGGSLRGIIRICGPRALRCLHRCFVSAEQQALSDVRRPSVIAGCLGLDPSLALPGDLFVWPGNRSYTRQPAAEFHTIGCQPLLTWALEEICRAGARLAEPGEFTLRAFLSGRIDLTQAEAVLAVIDSDSQKQLDVALGQLAGGLAGPLSKVRTELLHLLAEVEAGLDFVEEDIEFVSDAQLVNRLSHSADLLKSLSDQIKSRDSSGQSARVALIGWPNAGKSSLFNALAGQQRAITSGIAGTTRDFVSATIEIESLSVELIDTAGIESLVGDGGELCHSDVLNWISTQAAATVRDQRVHAAAQRQLAKQTEWAQLILFCVDGSRPMNPWEYVTATNPPANVLLVLTKEDCLMSSSPIDWAATPIQTSSLLGTGIERLRRAIFDAVIGTQHVESPVVGSTVARTSNSLRSAEESVRLARQAANSGEGTEIVAAEVRQALDQLGQVVGTIYTDDILDLVFSRFCIGK